MNDDDEVLVAWLRKQGFAVYTFEHITRITRQQSTPAERVSVTAEHLSMWVIPDKRPASAVWSKQLFATQRGNRRPLRGLVREWVLGL